MAKNMLKIQQVMALALVLALAAPVAIYASDGKKHFKQGLKFEENRQWDKAAEQFALAVAEKPSNVEFQLHLQRALVSAAIMLVERGDRLAEQKDFNAAYTAYRQAFAYDPTNELSLIKARRMLEAQGLPTGDLPTTGDPSGPKIKPKDSDPNMKTSFTGGAVLPGARNMPAQLTIPGRRFQKTDVIYRDTNLLTAIEQLAQTMKLNVIFDQMVVNQMRNVKITVEMRDVTHPKALEMLLKTNNLLYSQLDTRTVVIAADNPQSRMKYEDFAVRTFYIKNAELTDVRGAINGTLQTKYITPIKQLNALVVRDTPQNLELIEALIESIDKSKAEVLVDVNIYEVSRNDLLQLGNQFATPDSKDTLHLGALGGLGANNAIDNASRAHTIIGSLSGSTPLGFALGLPTSSISFFQNKGKAKLLASTQVHVLDGEANTVRIGQRVPIQTASLPSYGTISDTTRRRGTEQTGLNTSDFTTGLGGAFGVGIPQIQYENVGLNIDITPSVFEDDVQMKMKIESTSIDTSTGKLTPSFNQRTMSSVARIKDGQTTLVAGVSQLVESKGIKGIPLIGLIPILGRFFATPETDNRQSDVVITVTPHILRRADIQEKDHLAYAAGDAQSATNQLTIEQILYVADVEEAARNQVASGNGAATPPAAVAEVKPPPVAAPANTRTETPGVVVVSQPPVAPATQPQPQAIRPSVTKTTVDRPGAPLNQQNNKPDLDDDDDDDDDEVPARTNGSPILVSVRSASPIVTRGQDLYVAIIVNGNAEISSTHISMSYDPNILDVKAVRDGGLLRAGGASPELQFSAEGGVLNVQMDRPQGASAVPARGQLLLVVFTVKGQGQSPLTLNEQQTFMRSITGQVFPVKLQSGIVESR